MKCLATFWCFVHAEKAEDAFEKQKKFSLENKNSI